MTPPMPTPPAPPPPTHTTDPLRVIAYGRHNAKPSVSAHTRIRCALLDVLTSKPPPWTGITTLHIATDIHEPGPYFTDQLKLCWRVELPMTFPSLLSQYSFIDDNLVFGPISFRIFTCIRGILRGGSTIPFYTIWAEVEARDHSNQRIHVTNDDGQLKPLTAVITFDWAVSEMGEDLAPNLDWNTIANIIAHYAKIRYNNGGEAYPDGVFWGKLFEDPNPLEEFGYLGWPSAMGWRGNGAHLLTFRRKEVKSGEGEEKVPGEELESKEVEPKKMESKEEEEEEEESYGLDRKGGVVLAFRENKVQLEEEEKEEEDDEEQ